MAKVATITPTMLDIAWAAGIYEGEGTAGYTRVKGRKLDRGTQKVAVYQKDSWLIIRFQELFGGAIGKATTRPGCEIWYWAVYGPRARGFLMSVFHYLSPRRREQAKKALAGIFPTPRINKHLPRFELTSAVAAGTNN